MERIVIIFFKRIKKELLNLTLSVFLVYFRELDLKKPIYQKTCVYGHFKDGFTWEVPKELKVE